MQSRQRGRVWCGGGLGAWTARLSRDLVQCRRDLAGAVEHRVVTRIDRHHSYTRAQVRRHPLLMPGRQWPAVPQALDIRARRGHTAAPMDRFLHQGGRLPCQPITGPARPRGVQTVEERPLAHSPARRKRWARESQDESARRPHQEWERVHHGRPWAGNRTGQADDVRNPVGDLVGQWQDDRSSEGVANKDEPSRRGQVRSHLTNACGEGERGEVAGAGPVPRQIDGESGQRQQGPHLVPDPPAGVAPVYQDKRILHFVHRRPSET